MSFSNQAWNRRRFLRTAAGVGAAALAGPVAGADDKTPSQSPKAQTALPRWRGFNLLYFFHSKSDATPLEQDFQWIADFGFDFVRLPMCYTLWTEGGDAYKIKESVLERIDQVVEWGDKYGLHVNLNFHRAPGYSVNKEMEEPYRLGTDPEAMKAFAFHWQMFAKRYKGVSTKKLSFDLVNEPADLGGKGMTREQYATVARDAVAAIREIDTERLIMSDGYNYGTLAMPELKDLKGVGQSCRGYEPHRVSHYQASWAGGMDYPVPTWPLKRDKDRVYDRAYLETFYAPWADLARQGVGVHCGECGCYNRTPHAVAIAWLSDVFDILKNHNIGFSLWNLRGSFGIIDSGRNDVAYEDFHGHKLDRKMLAMLQRS